MTDVNWEPAAETEARQILNALFDLTDQVSRLRKAVDSIGESNQWLVDNTKDLFELLHSPMLAGMMGSMMPSMPVMMPQTLDSVPLISGAVDGTQD